VNAADAIRAALLSRVAALSSGASGYDPLIATTASALADCDQPPGVESDAFIDFIAQRILGAQSVAQLAVTDLHLAFRCLAGDARAIVELTLRLRPVTATAMRRAGLAGAQNEDALQNFFERLLVAGPTRRPKLEQYQGRSELEHWVRVAATRFALDALRGRDANGPLPEEHPEATGALGNPEIAYFEQLYGPQLKEALTRAFAQLSAKERTLLRQHYFDRLSLEAIGRMENVHRTTVARWLTSAEEAIFTSVRRGLRDQLGCGERTLEDILASLRDHVDLSLHRFLPGSTT
jgi:RNA polymerase sigma-70 factor (ECF subfamily)